MPVCMGLTGDAAAEPWAAGVGVRGRGSSSGRAPLCTAAPGDDHLTAVVPPLALSPRLNR